MYERYSVGHMQTHACLSMVFVGASTHVHMCVNAFGEATHNHPLPAGCCRLWGILVSCNNSLQQLIDSVVCLLCTCIEHVTWVWMRPIVVFVTQCLHMSSSFDSSFNKSATGYCPAPLIGHNRIMMMQWHCGSLTWTLPFTCTHYVQLCCSLIVFCSYWANSYLEWIHFSSSALCTVTTPILHTT